MSGGGGGNGGDGGGSAGFSKLVGRDFEHYMHGYSMVIGRNSTISNNIDLDLSSVQGGGRNISRRHARIYYDFQRFGFFLEVLGGNGCTAINGLVFRPGHAPVRLVSQDLIQIGDVQFYFLLPRPR